MKVAELEQKVIDFIKRHNLILPKETLVVGVSGGADSVCLLHFLARWQGKLDIKLHVAHLDHQLRGAESEADANYVANLANRFNMPITIGKKDVATYRAERRLPLEEAAREQRYSFLAQVADDVRANRVAIGHTRDDQVETILMHILRGTGTSGLRGLEPCSPIPSRSCQLSAISYHILVVRPLLNITREETLNYCQEYQLKPRVDSSNLSLSFFRNRLRLELLPSLRKYNPSVDQALLRLAEIAGDDSCFIEQQAFQWWSELAKQEDNAIYLDKRKICALPIALQRQLIRLAVDRVLGDTRDIEASHVEAIRLLLAKPVGKRISLPRGIICQSDYDEVVIASTCSVASPEATELPSSACPFSPLQGEFPLKVPGETVLPGWQVIASIIPERAASLSLRGTKCRSNLVADFDLEQIGIQLSVRQRRQGDRFHPLGMDTPKKLQDFMVDAKIPLHWRDHIPLVCSPRQIIWVVGWRIDERVKVTEATKEILRLEFIKP